MILLWGLSHERPLAAVRAALEDIGQPLVLLDQREISEVEIELCADHEITGSVRQDNQSFRLEDITAAYLRPYDLASLPITTAIGSNTRAMANALACTEVLWAWAELTPAKVVNRPSSMVANSSKPYQSAQIARLGFATPRTLITNDSKAAHAFWSKLGTVIYKSISGQRSIVSRLTAAHATRWRYLAWCPTQFQEYIPGTDYRVHVIGEEMFACEIVSAADDYRYAHCQGKPISIRAVELPLDIRNRCMAMTRAMKLEVAGLDFRRTPEGQWYCFEVNPSPAFTFYQDATHQPIAEAIARLLAGAK